LAKLAAKSELRTKFFDFLFEDNEGFICIATSDPRAPKSRFRQEFFRWPQESIRCENYILQLEEYLNCYFCVNLLSKPSRLKENCLPTDFLWADLDFAHPDQRQPEPQVVLESSPGRFQAFWKLSTKIDPIMAEGYAKRIAYAWDGDKSGWDLTQLLRIPFTKNQKYNGNPEVQLLRSLETLCAPLLFEALPEIDNGDAPTIATILPNADDIPPPEAIIYKYTVQLRGSQFLAMYTQEAQDDDDWSKQLWRLIHICLEAGMSDIEVFSVVRDSPINKYKRDDRPESHLWRDIQKAAAGAQRLAVISADFRPLVMPELVDIMEPPPITDGFVDKYREWAIDATDAVPEFHNLSAFIALSAVISNSVRLETQYGSMIPNIWGMILGDSTLTRKTTAMKLAVMDIITTIDKNIILATDGTAEGLLTGLSERNNKCSIFYKDELSGFFESINRRDYLAGMPETLTALYDVPPVFTRRLRKETIFIESPIFIFFGGGVRDRVYEALSEEYVISGFLPRFLVVGGDTDLDKLRRTGPPTEEGVKKRAALIADVANLYELYAAQEVFASIGGEKVKVPARITAHLTNDAWELNGRYEEMMVKVASESAISNLALPTFERMSRSLLKMAVIIAAERQVPKDEAIMVEVKDVQTAAWYVQRWGPFSIDLIMNAGKRVGERSLDKIVSMIQGNPGILRSTIMQQRHLSKREADELLGTLEDRQLVRKEQQGRGYRYYIA
jgi:hypothetical protein